MNIAPSLCFRLLRLPSPSLRPASRCLSSAFLFLRLSVVPSYAPYFSPPDPIVPSRRLRSHTLVFRCLPHCLLQAHNQHPVEKHSNMAAASAPLTTNDSSSNPTMYMWNHHNTPTTTTQVTQASKAPPDTTHLFLGKLSLRLEEEQLSLGDLPTTEELLWGMLYGFGFHKLP